jgi:hypothetical protein
VQRRQLRVRVGRRAHERHLVCRKHGTGSTAVTICSTRTKLQLWTRPATRQPRPHTCRLVQTPCTSKDKARATSHSNS